MKKFFALLIILGLALLPTVSLAQASAAKPFGGMVLVSFYCNASNNFLLVVGPPRGTTYYGTLFFYDPARTDLRMFRQVRVGVWLLGLFNGNAECKIYTPYGIITIARGKLITLTGTSM